MGVISRDDQAVPGSVPSLLLLKNR